MFEIDYRSRKPIYEQICDKVKEMIALKMLKNGEQLPTVRNLAKETGINPNTIQKAFAKLEQERVIYRVLGKGSFVSVGENETNILKTQALDEITRVIDKNKIYDINKKDIMDIADEIFDNKDFGMLKTQDKDNERLGENK